MVLTDECWVDTSLFNELAGELVDHTSVGERWRAFNVRLLEDFLKEGVCFIGMEFLRWRELLSSRLLQLGAWYRLLATERGGQGKPTSSQPAAKGLPS